jgi:hypothetical protein
MGALFLTTYSLALGNPVPHRIPAALVGNPAAHPSDVRAIQTVAHGALHFRRYTSMPAARQALNEQDAYAALDVTAPRVTLYVASAAGASVARALEKIYAVAPGIRVIDAHPLSSTDPVGVDVFYLMLVASIVGFVTTFQVRAQVEGFALRHHVSFVLVLALAGGIVLSSVEGLLLHRPAAVGFEETGILALHILAVASFASLMAVLVGAWAIVPTWLFFVVLGNASSGGVISPPLLRPPFAFLSQWLPSGSTVTALRDAIYFQYYQHAHPLIVLGLWATLLFASWLVVSRRQEASLARR